MAITAVTPVASSILDPGDSFSFTIDNTYTVLQVEVDTQSGVEYAYDDALGGAQAGYTVTVTPSGGQNIFVISRDAGWDTDPQTLRVIEDEAGGSPVTTGISYFLSTTQLYPEGHRPYNAESEGILSVTEDDVAIRTDVGILDFDDASFNVTDMGSGKVRVVGITAGSALTVEDEGTPLSTNVMKINFAGTGVTATEPVTDEILVTIPGSSITVEDEGTPLTTAVTLFDFAGAGVTVTEPVADQVLVTIPGGSGGDLDATINAGTPDNDVNIPATDPVILRDNGGSITPVTIIKSEATSSTPAFKIQQQDNFSTGMEIEETGTGTSTLFNYNSIEPQDNFTFIIGNRTALGSGSGTNVLEGNRTGAGFDGGNVRIAGGNATAGTDDGGDVSIFGGDTVGGVPGDINIGTSTTTNVTIGSGSSTNTIGGSLDVQGNITLTGTVDGIDIATDVAANTAKVTNANHTGDATGDTVLTIANNAVNNAKLDDMAGFTVKAKPTTGTGDPSDLSVGTNTVVGRVAGDVEAAQIVAAQITTNTITGGPSGNLALTTITGDNMAFDSVNNTKLNNMAANTVKVRNAATLGDPVDMAVGTNEVVGRLGADIVSGQVQTAQIADDAVSLAKMASGTAGNLITFDASGNPAAVATGTATHVLTSNGAGAAPTFQVPAAGGSGNWASLEWTWVAATSTPATNKFSANSGTKSAVTNLYFHETCNVPSTPVLFAANYLNQFSIGDTIIVQRSSNPTGEQTIYQVTGAPSVTSNVWNLPVTYKTTTGGTTFSTNNYSTIRYPTTALATSVNGVGASPTLTTASYAIIATIAGATLPGNGKYQLTFTSDLINNTATATTDFQFDTVNTIFTVFTKVTNSQRTIINDSTTERQIVAVNGIATTTAGSPNIVVRGRTSTGTATLGEYVFTALRVG